MTEKTEKTKDRRQKATGTETKDKRQKTNGHRQLQRQRQTSTTGVLQEYYRSTTGVLQEYYNVLQRALGLQPPERATRRDDQRSSQVASPRSRSAGQFPVWERIAKFTPPTSDRSTSGKESTTGVLQAKTKDKRQKTKDKRAPRGRSTTVQGPPTDPSGAPGKIPWLGTHMLTPPNLRYIFHIFLPDRTKYPRHCDRLAGGLPPPITP